MVSVTDSFTLTIPKLFLKWSVLECKQRKTEGQFSCNQSSQKLFTLKPQALSLKKHVTNQ